MSERVVIEPQGMRRVAQVMHETAHEYRQLSGVLCGGWLPAMPPPLQGAIEVACTSSLNVGLAALASGLDMLADDLTRRAKQAEDAKARLIPPAQNTGSWTGARMGPAPPPRPMTAEEEVQHLRQQIEDWLARVSPQLDREFVQGFLKAASEDATLLWMLVHMIQHPEEFGPLLEGVLAAIQELAVPSEKTLQLVMDTAGSLIDWEDIKHLQLEKAAGYMAFEILMMLIPGVGLAGRGVKIGAAAAERLVAKLGLKSAGKVTHALARLGDHVATDWRGVPTAAKEFRDANRAVSRAANAACVRQEELQQASSALRRLEADLAKSSTELEATKARNRKQLATLMEEQAHEKSSREFRIRQARIKRIQKFERQVARGEVQIPSYDQKKRLAALAQKQEVLMSKAALAERYYRGQVRLHEWDVKLGHLQDEALYEFVKVMERNAALHRQPQGGHA